MSVEKLYTVYDVKAGFYLSPIVFKTNSEAMRWFSDCVNAFDNRFYAHPEDYTLFELGTFDNTTCTCVFDNMKSLAQGIECVDDQLRKQYVSIYNNRMGITNPSQGS